MSILDQMMLFAAEKIDPSSIGFTPVRNADGVVANVLTTVYTFAGIICVIVIIVAGVFYTTSAADPSQVKRAKNAIIGAVVGLIIIAMAFAITQFILGRI